MRYRRQALPPGRSGSACGRPSRCDASRAASTPIASRLPVGSRATRSRTDDPAPRSGDVPTAAAAVGAGLAVGAVASPAVVAEGTGTGTSAASPGIGGHSEPPLASRLVTIDGSSLGISPDPTSTASATMSVGTPIRSFGMSNVVMAAPYSSAPASWVTSTNSSWSWVPNSAWSGGRSSVITLWQCGQVGE